MTKRITAVAAALMAAVGGNPIFALASRAGDLPSDDKQLDKVLGSTKFSEFACTACGTHMHAHSGTDPFCVTCGAGSGKVSEVKANAKPKVSAKSDLVSLQCSTCNHATVMEANVVKTLVTASSGGPVRCSCCGGDMFLTASADEDGTSSDTSLITPDTPVVANADEMGEDDDIDLDDLEASLNLSAASDDEDKEDEDDGDKEDDDKPEAKKDDESDAEDDEDVKSNVENFGGKQAAPFKKEAAAEDGATGDTALVTPDAPDTLEADMVLEPFTLEEDDVLDLDDGDPFAEGPVATTEEFVEDFDLPEVDGDPLLDAMELDDTDAALAFVRANGRVLAVKGHVTVAAFTRKSAGKNLFLMNSDALPAAARASVLASGLRKGLEEVGFQLVRVPTSVSATTKREVQRVQAAAKEAEQNRQKEFPKIFALAAAGLNRGNWRGFSNPLRAAMERELEAIGVESPRRVTARILEESGLQYSQTLLEVCAKLSGMSASSRKELSDMLDLTNVVASVKDSDGGDSEPEHGLEARLTKPALLRPITAASSAVGVSGAAAILSGSAPLKFGSV